MPEARTDDIPVAMKKTLALLQTVQGAVPCTDAARRIMRSQLASMSQCFGDWCRMRFGSADPCDNGLNQLTSTSGTVYSCATRISLTLS